jgi:hypothetical protein
MLEKESADPTTTMPEPPARTEQEEKPSSPGALRMRGAGWREGNGRMPAEEKTRESAGSAGVGEEKYGRRGTGLGLTATGRR